jgi:hypothetical protein
VLKGETRVRFITTFLRKALDLRPWADSVNNITLYLCNQYAPLSTQNVYLTGQSYRLDLIKNKSTNIEQSLANLGSRLRIYQMFHVVLSLSLGIPVISLPLVHGGVDFGGDYGSGIDLYNRQIEFSRQYSNTSLQKHNYNNTNTTNNNNLGDISTQQVVDWGKKDFQYETDLCSVMNTYTTPQQNTIIRGDLYHMPISPLLQSLSSQLVANSVENTNLGGTNGLKNDQSNTPSLFLPTQTALDCLQSLTYTSSLINSLYSLNKTDVLVIVNEIKAILLKESQSILQLVPFVLTAIGFHSFNLVNLPVGGGDLGKNNKHDEQYSKLNYITSIQNNNYDISTPLEITSVQTLSQSFISNKSDKLNKTDHLFQHNYSQFYLNLYQKILKITNNGTNNFDQNQNKNSSTAVMSLDEFINLCQVPQPVLLSYLSVISNYATALSCIGMFQLTLQFNFKLFGKNQNLEQNNDKNNKNGQNGQNGQNDDSDDSNDDYNDSDDSDTDGSDNGGDNNNNNIYKKNESILHKKTEKNKKMSKIAKKKQKKRIFSKEMRSNNIPISFGHIPLLSYHTDTITTNLNVLNLFKNGLPVSTKLQNEITILEPIILSLAGKNNSKDQNNNNNNSFFSLLEAVQPIQLTLSSWKYHYCLLSQSPQFSSLEYSLWNEFFEFEKLTQNDQNMRFIIDQVIYKLIQFYPTWHRNSIIAIYNFFSQKLNNFETFENSTKFNKKLSSTQKIEKIMLILRGTISLLATIYSPGHIESMTAGFGFLSQLLMITIGDYNNNNNNNDQIENAFLIGKKFKFEKKIGKKNNINPNDQNRKKIATQMKKNGEKIGVNMVSHGIKRKSTKVQYEHGSDDDYDDSEDDYKNEQNNNKNDIENNKNNTKPNKRGKPNSVPTVSTNSTHLTRRSTPHND